MSKRDSRPHPVGMAGLSPEWRDEAGVTFQDRLMLRRFAAGQSYVEASSGLGVTPATLRTRGTRFRARMGLSSRTDLGAWARDNVAVWEEPARRHVRETTTSTTLLGEGTPGFLLADCSCGGGYTVPEGGDEYAALEAAHAAHVRKAEGS